MRGPWILALLGACGGHEAVTPDGCTGHLACGCAVELVSQDGGNLIFDDVTLDTELQQALGAPATVNRAVAYFIDTGRLTPFPVPNQCNNLVASRGWPIFNGDPHTDLAVGSLTITGQRGDGTVSTIDVPQQAEGTDLLGRHHDVFYQQVNPNAAAFARTDFLYQVALGGTGDLMPKQYDLFVPAQFAVADPGLEDDGPLVAGTDLTVHWTPQVSTNIPVGDEVIGLVWLSDPNGSPTHVCPVTQSAGQLTISGATIAEYKQIAIQRGLPGDHAILTRQAIVHKVGLAINDTSTVSSDGRRCGETRRYDLLGSVSFAQLVRVQ